MLDVALVEATIVCAWCNTTFPPKRYNHKYCTTKCRNASIATRVAFVPTSIACASCGKDFNALHVNSRYCSKECTRDGRRAIERLCVDCGKPVKPDTTRCVACCARNSIEWRKRHPERSKANEKIWRDSVRANVLNHYGNGMCACCGETNERFLTVDHINNDGAEHKRSSTNGICRDLIKRGYPPGIQILCFNCNCGRALNGGVCPHVENRAKIAVCV